MSSAETKRAKAKGRLTKGSYLSIPREVANSPRYLGLSGNAVKLLAEFAYQYNGFNNGALGVSWARMKGRGWKSNGTLWRALGELLVARMVVQTKQGGLRMRGLYALTWHAIDENSRLGVEGTNVAPGGWRDPLTTDATQDSPRRREHWANPKRPKAKASVSRVVIPGHHWGPGTLGSSAEIAPKQGAVSAPMRNASPSAETAPNRCRNSTEEDGVGFE